MANQIIGIDVGTASVRGGLVDVNGNLSKIFVAPIKTWNPRRNFYQQSSEDIWRACCHVVQNLVKDTEISSIKGIGFDATCSLAVFDSDGKPVAVEPNGDDEQNVIQWIDHRAAVEANIINETKDKILQYVGGKISLEMAIPKILWLKRNNIECWRRAHHYFLLSDFLTWKCTDVEDRSLCSVVCKFNYEASPAGKTGWNKEYFDKLDLSELSENNWKKLGSKILKPGDLVGKLTAKAAEELHLWPGMPVGTSLIDGHAGCLGIMGCHAPGISNEFETRLALISGTSTCHMLEMKDKRFVPGVWGPYYGAVLPGLWLLEGGQSASGVVLDHVIETHAATASIKAKLDGRRITTYLDEVLCSMMKKNSKISCTDELAKDVHVWPDFHGNRSPLADPTMRGVIVGLSLSKEEEDLAVLYLATIQALAYATKHIMSTIESGAKEKIIESVIICGGLSRNEQFVQTHANVLGLPVLIPQNGEAMILGAAETGAAAAGIYPNLNEAVMNMGGPAKFVKPYEGISKFHEKKYEVFLELLSTQYKCREIMKTV